MSNMSNTSRHAAEIDLLLYPQEAVPKALTPLERLGLSPEAPFFRGMPMGLETFLRMPFASAPGHTIKGYVTHSPIR